MADLLTSQYRTCAERCEAHQFDDYADLADGRKWFRTTLSPCIDPDSRHVTRIMALSQNITSVMQMFERAEANALTDALTGLPNRRRFEEAVRAACEESAASGRNFALCVVDLDELKPINDRFGHRAGDDAIRRVGEVLGRFVQGDELAARIGGDEFFLLLSASDQDSLDARLSSLRALIAPGLHVPGISHPVHVSIGGAVWTPGACTSETLSLADAAMYAEKCSRRLALSRLA